MCNGLKAWHSLAVSFQKMMSTVSHHRALDQDTLQASLWATRRVTLWAPGWATRRVESVFFLQPKIAVLRPMCNGCKARHSLVSFKMIFTLCDYYSSTAVLRAAYPGTLWPTWAGDVRAPGWVIQKVESVFFLRPKIAIFRPAEPCHLFSDWDAQRASGLVA